jgi:hypothetical protein
MFEPVNVIIGAEAVSVPTALNLLALRHLKPHLKRFGSELDLVEMTEVGTEVIATALVISRPDLVGKPLQDLVSPIAAEVVSIQTRLQPAEFPGVAGSVMKIMVAAGYWKDPRAGEAKPDADPAA